MTTANATAALARARAQGSLDARFVAEVLRINTRYLEEFVERHNVCPFARATRERGALFRYVFSDEEPRDLTAGLAALQELELEPKLEIGMLIFPRARGEMREFDQYTRALRTAYENPRGVKAPLVLAPFHPRAAFGQKTPAAMTMFWRHAPDPFIQVVPVALLAEVKSKMPGGKFVFDGSAASFAELEKRNRPSVSERISRDNFALRDSVGLDVLAAQLAEICADRDRSYSQFGVA